MATSVLWTISVFITSLIISHVKCDSVQPKIRESLPANIVEIVERTIVQRPNGSAMKDFGIQRVSQEGSAPEYEIYLTSNKNLKDIKGAQKIKIFVEDENYELPQMKKSEQKEKQSAFEVSPLSIETVGLNIDRHQHSVVPNVKLNSDGYDEFSQKDFESYPSKRQTNWGQRPSTNFQPEIKEVIIQREPSYVDQNNPHQPIIIPKKEERARAPLYDSNYPTSSQNGKRVTQKVYNIDYSSSIEEPTSSQNRPNSKRNYETSYEEFRQPERRPSDREPEAVRPSYGQEKEYRPSGNVDMSYVREAERRPTYETERNPAYVESEKPRLSNDRYPGYDAKPTNNRNPYSDERRRPYNQETSDLDDYDRQPTDSSRPVRDNGPGYSGFPESYQTDVNNHYSKPLQYEPARVFPASPCPQVFKYEGREPEEDRWFANIYVTTDEVLTGMRLDIKLDKPAEIMTNWVAEVKTKDSMHFTLLSLTHKLLPGPAETVRIMVKFNGKKPVPFVKSINLNGRSICPQSRTQKTTTRRPVYENPGDLQLRRTSTESYKEVPKRPGGFIEDYDRTTTFSKRTTPVYEENRKTTIRPPAQYLRPNPNGYEETDQNSFSAPTKKPPGRPAHSNGKPPPHAAKPAQGGKPGNGNAHGHAHNRNPPKNPPVENKPSPIQSNPPIVQKPITCGTPSVQPRPLITHGQATSRGQWPWHVALYKNVGTDLNFFCGGSLINKNYVVTAAHCVSKTYTTKPLDENTLVVYLGKYHLKLWSEGGVQNRQVSKIYVHPKYNSTDFSSDIAVLALSSPVEYTDYIRPICLWDRSNTRIEDIEGKEGTVVGWGFDETKKLTEELRQAKMPVVQQKTCLWSYPDFYPQFTSNMTYCAGFKNGTSVCNGDSGGGMVFPYKDKTGVERWHLRGIVSISPARNDSKVCDPTHYVVFTDVAKFLPWLDSFL